jgi:hypothetical protein
MKASAVNASGVFLSGVLPEEGSPPPSSTPDIELEKAVRERGRLFYLMRENLTIETRTRACSSS